MKLPGLFIDGFAGGGGASTGIAQAIGRDPDIAVNHSPTAIAIHKANHPDTDHHCCDIRLPFLPRTATRGRKVWGVWFSPDCKERSADHTSELPSLLRISYALFCLQKN